MYDLCLAATTIRQGIFAFQLSFFHDNQDNQYAYYGQPTSARNTAKLPARPKQLIFTLQLSTNMLFTKEEYFCTHFGII